MAAVSTQSLPVSPPPQQSPSPTLKGIKKVLSKPRSGSIQSDSATLPVLRSSSDLPHLEKSPTLQSSRSPSRDDGSTKSGSSGVRKLLPGHAKRKRRRVRDEELKIAAEDAERGRSPGIDPVSLPQISNTSTSSLVTDDSELESPPPLINRESHSGLLTLSSPLIKTATVDSVTESPSNVTMANQSSATSERFPSIVEPTPDQSSSPHQSPSPRSPLSLASSPSLPAPGLIDKADTLQPDFRIGRSGSFSRLRGKSPARKLMDKIAKPSKSPRTSPERLFDTGFNMEATGLPRASTSMSERRSTQNPDMRTPSPLQSQPPPSTEIPPAPKSAMPALQTAAQRPETPPSAIRDTPSTTVTPPTPTEAKRASAPASPKIEIEGVSSGDESSGIVVSQDGNMISHRRIRSTSSATHQKSKLSTSMAPPLTPTIEEVKTPTSGDKPPGSRSVTPGGGFFSSWVSAAQTAASTITNLTNQNRSRSGTNDSDLSKSKSSEEPAPDAASSKEIESPKKQLAVETLGSGSLNFGHLGIEHGLDDKSLSLSQLDDIQRKSDLGSQKEEAAAKIEDMLAKRAVSQAYEKPPKSGEGTPIAEIPDPVASIKSVQSFDVAGGTLTPPNGSIFEGETGPIKRSNSVRSKIQNRRSRGSSVTTGQSAISAMVGASTAALANPATGPRLSGFAIAPKQRNRAFHQQFRSVPEDDYLIEDYSCALQKEILLAGRLYISEGHICFSSNILGWVTTLIISFEEVVSIEKENTAIVIPNAIAVQTLHARHTFRSLLSREATYDLMIGIWKVSHPDSFNKSMNSKQLAVDEAKPETAVAADGVGPEEQSSGEGSDSGSHEDDGSDDNSAPSIIASSGSIAGSDTIDARSVIRKPSGPNGVAAPTIGASASAPSGDAVPAVAPVVATTDAAVDFPGPVTHAPTDCTDKATHYDKIIKDEVVAAPLGKVYSLLYGPQSGVFVRRFLEDGVSKVQELQMEDDKKGLNNEIKTRQYRYIKPLGGGIGPKQTNCITTENLDFFDLEKAVTVTCTTQTPDVPSGNAFSTKTRYCLTWAPGNATRFQMNMTIEWTAKSWLKGPIEKGALDGQTQYGEDLVKTLKGTLGRTRAATIGSKTGKVKKKRKSSKREKTEKAETETKREEHWGLFEPVRPILGPAIEILHPLARMEVLVGILTIMVLWMWMRGGSGNRAISFPLEQSGRVVAYDQLWRQEENDLWEWLEQRVGVDTAIVRDRLNSKAPSERQQMKQRQKLLKSNDAGERILEQKRSMREAEEAVRVTKDRLAAVEELLERRRRSSSKSAGPG